MQSGNFTAQTVDALDVEGADPLSEDRETKYFMGDKELKVNRPQVRMDQIASI